MDFGSDVMGNQSHDTLAIADCENFTGIGQPLGETVDPYATVGIQHHLDNFWIIQEAAD